MYEFDSISCYLNLKEILHYAEFPLYTKRFLSDIVATYNQFHNILRLFDVLPNFSFTTSEETMGNEDL